MQQQDTPARDTKTEIHRVALELFSSRGYEKTSLREIAEHVGITKASLYYHYSSKQDLLRAIIGTFFEDLARVLELADTVEWSPARERELVSAYVQVAVMHRTTGPTLLRDITAVLAAFEDRLGDLIAQSRRFQRWLAGPGASVADQVRAAAAIEVVGAVFSSDLGPDQISDEELHDIVVDAAMAILARRDGSGAVEGPATASRPTESVG